MHEPVAPDVRGLDRRDLERIVAIDREHTGRIRRHFFDKRFAAAAARPENFVDVGVVRRGSLGGYAMARLMRGEFGREHVIAVLDAIGVDAASQEMGVGHALMSALVSTLKSRGARSLHSQADWTNHALLGFFEASGFQLAPRLVLERAVSEPLPESAAEA
jgi:ribosomal protein S18 acetylase RimI-like enzyme